MDEGVIYLSEHHEITKVNRLGEEVLMQGVQAMRSD